MSQTRNLTKSQPHNLLSMARSNSARSRTFSSGWSPTDRSDFFQLQRSFLVNKLPLFQGRNGFAALIPVARDSPSMKGIPFLITKKDACGPSWPQCRPTTGAPNRRSYVKTRSPAPPFMGKVRQRDFSQRVTSASTRAGWLNSNAVVL